MPPTKRPVLIVSNDDYNQHFADILVCVITSQKYADDYSVTLSDSDLEIGFLPEKSVVKTHKLFSIYKGKILKKFSRVKSEFYEKVAHKIADLVTEQEDVL